MTHSDGVCENSLVKGQFIMAWAGKPERDGRAVRRQQWGGIFPPQGLQGQVEGAVIGTWIEEPWL